MSKNNATIIPAAVAVIFLLAAIFGAWPYVFYQILRWVVTGCALALAWRAFEFARADR
jgi:hypothetical protein